MIRYESSRGHKIDRTQPNQTGNTVGEKNREVRPKETDKNSKGHRLARRGHIRYKQIKNNHRHHEGTHRRHKQNQKKQLLNKIDKHIIIRVRVL